MYFTVKHDKPIGRADKCLGSEKIQLFAQKPQKTNTSQIANWFCFRTYSWCKVQGMLCVEWLAASLTTQMGNKLAISTMEGTAPDSSDSGQANVGMNDAQKQLASLPYAGSTDFDAFFDMSTVRQGLPSKVLDYQYGNGVCFWSKTMKQLKADHPFSSNEGDCIIMQIQTACSAKAFRIFLEKWGIDYIGYEPNPAATRKGSKLYKRFTSALKEIPDLSTLAVVFHGTREANINKILSNGLDPSMRSRQRYGPGEYFSFDPKISLNYCKMKQQEGHYDPKTMKMIVFLVVLPFDSVLKEDGCPPQFIIVQKTNHQLPLGLLEFNYDKFRRPTRLEHSKASKWKLHELARESRLLQQELEMAVLREKIIDCITKDDMDAASTLYEKNRAALCERSKLEIASLIYRMRPTRYRETVNYHFPDLPKDYSPPPDENSMGHHPLEPIRSVDVIQKEADWVQQQLLEAREKPDQD